jgi:hypothetical protein
MRAKTPVISSTLQPLNPRLEKAIAAYATAASAVGIALLATAPPARAEIVYTKTRLMNLPFNLDLNHDGIIDFRIGTCSCRPQGQEVVVQSSEEYGLFARHATGSENGVIAAPGNTYSAAALRSGAPIGPKQVFHNIGGSAPMAFWGSYISTTYAGGPWSGVTGRYLGLKFLIDGEFHYGWARLTVAKKLNHIVLTGYAYETIPNKPLKAGQTSETADEARTYGETFGPTLGMLALGADGMALWRREDSLEALAAPKPTLS